MKQLLFKSLVLTLAFALFATPFSRMAHATDNDVTAATEQEKELAEKLEFMFEEATIKSKSGKPIQMDFKKIEEKFGKSPELNKLKHEINTMNKPAKRQNEVPGKAEAPPFLECNIEEPQTFGIQSHTYDPVDRCIEQKIRNNWTDFIGIAALTMAIDYITQGKYLSAAKKLVNAGVRGNAIAIAATLSWYLSYCLWTEGDNPW
ncbi:hypothetical protein ACGTN9_10995 [Halobacillus sp. MO56]